MSAAPTPRKSFWDTVLTSTPVALTVVATILAGLSSSEMTRAQYHRSLAAQEQSKTSDEWAYFQAKKYRATYSAGTAAQLQLQSSRQPITVAALTTLFDHLADVLLSLDAWARQLFEGLKDMPRTLPDGKASRLTRMLDRAVHYRKGVWERLEAVQAAKDNFARQVQQADGSSALALLASGELPTVGAAAAPDLMKDLAAINPRLPEACAAIDNRRPKEELNPLCNQISEKDVRAALDAVTDEAKRFDDAQEPVNQALDRIGRLVDDGLAALAWAREETSNLHREAGITTAKNEEGVQTNVADRARELAEESAAAERRAADFGTARLRYNARRYNYEARTNQVSAWLHEIQVEKSSLTSERHRYRSSLFFFGMLAAQAGVTIATITLALRRRSIFWALATLAGLTAVALGGYVYLFI
jgi:Domain of unknown function (DUF4337)